jgi:hypothetical protein
MAYTYDSLLIRQGERLQAERAQAMAELESGRVNEDLATCDMAADRILKIDQDFVRLNQIANDYVVRQQAPRGNQFGLSPEQVEVAHNSFGPIKREGRYVDLSNAEKEKLYAEQVNRYHHLLATGQYRNQTG